MDKVDAPLQAKHTSLMMIKMSEFSLIWGNLKIGQISFKAEKVLPVFAICGGFANWGRIYHRTAIIRTQPPHTLTHKYFLTFLII